MRSDEALAWIERSDGSFRASGNAGGYGVEAEPDADTWVLIVHSFDDGGVVPHPGIQSADLAKSYACTIDLIESAYR